MLFLNIKPKVGIFCQEKLRKMMSPCIFKCFTKSILKTYLTEGKKTWLWLCDKGVFYVKDVCLQIRVVVINTFELSLQVLPQVRNRHYGFTCSVNCLVFYSSLSSGNYIVVDCSKSYVYKLWLQGHEHNWSWTSLDFIFFPFLDK